MLFTIGLTGLDQLLQLLFVLGFCLVLFLYGIALFLEADFLYGLSTPFDYVETIEGQRCNSVAELSEDDRQTVHEEWQI